jgi:hypothetical protein
MERATMARGKRRPYEVRAYVSRELYDRLLREAAARHLNVSECLRADLEEFYAIRDELASAVSAKAAETSPGRRIMHTLLSEMEARIAADITSQAPRLLEIEKRLAQVAAMIDRHYAGMMLHLPEVPDSDAKARSTSALNRYRAWKRAVTELLQDDETSSGQLVDGDGKAPVGGSGEPVGAPEPPGDSPPK